GGGGPELPRARGGAPQSRVDEPGSDGGVPPAAQRAVERLVRSAAAQRGQQPDEAVHGCAAIHGSADDLDGAVLRAVPDTELHVRARQRLRAAAASVPRGGCLVLSRGATDYTDISGHGLHGSTRNTSVCLRVIRGQRGRVIRGLHFSSARNSRAFG